MPKGRNRKSSIMHFLVGIVGLIALFSTVVTAHPPLQLDIQQGSPLGSLDVQKLDPITPQYRLNGTIIPSHYDLELLVLLDNDPQFGEQFTVPGRVTIDVTPSDSTSEITLHSYLLAINASSIRVTNVAQPSQPIMVTGVSNQTEEGVQFFTIFVDTPLDAGEQYQVYIEFVAQIAPYTERMNGLYWSAYIDPETGDEKRVAGTQMESIHARKLFPCFDEPELKATFDVTIIRKFNYTSLANTNLISTTVDPTRIGFFMDKYNTTCIMSTYLFAMVVSDFSYAEADLPTFQGKPVRVYAPPYMIERGGGNYSAQVGAELLQFFDDYFQFPYPLMKMDQASLPQFGPGAMENYGLNLYRESLLIYYEGETLETSRNSITSVLSHELAHQNFGNLVSLNWWTQIWVNEGFATYVANLGVNAVRPEFRAMEERIGQLQNSMVADVAPSSHPLQNNVPPTAPDSHVGAITYDKGASVNRMTEYFLTEATYQKGLRYYLQDMQYKAAHSDDLFRNFDRAAMEDNRLPAGLTVKAILDTWTLQRGHPVVRVSVAGPNSVYFTQERYAHTDENPGNLWYVPITVVTEGKPDLVNHIPEVWMSSTTVITNYTHNTSEWIMVNQDGTGYYRVLYDDDLTSLILNQLARNSSMISALSRSQLLDDYFTLAFREHVDIETAFDLTRYLGQEGHFAVWNVVFNHLRKTYNLLGASEAYPAFKEYMLPRLAPAILKVGLEQSPEHIGQAAIYRAKLIDWACSMELPGCFDYAQDLFVQWQSNPNVNPVGVDTQAVLFCAIVASGGQTEFQFVFDQYKSQPVGSTVKPRLLNALGCSMNDGILERLLDMALDSTSELARSDATTAIQRVAMNKGGKEIIFNLLETRLSEIISNVGSGSPVPVGSVVSTLSTYLSSQDDLNRLRLFVSDNSDVLAPINNSLQASINNVVTNIQWMNEFGKDIISWLNA